MFMPSINSQLSLGNILTILTMVISLSLGWGKITSTIDEMTMLRSIDIARVEKVENVSEKLQIRIDNIEKKNIEFSVDLLYIKQGITEIQTILKQKSFTNSKN